MAGSQLPQSQTPSLDSEPHHRPSNPVPSSLGLPRTHELKDQRTRGVIPSHAASFASE